MELKTNNVESNPKKFLLFHNNAHPHAADLTQLLLQDFKWEVLGHSPYSPDLAPSDFRLFLGLKKHLEGCNFELSNEFELAIIGFLKNQKATWNAAGIDKLASQYKCLNCPGDYVEK